MTTTLSIQVKAFFLLLVFTSGFIAICHCNHAAAAVPKVSTGKHDCCKKKETKESKQENSPCDKTDGCCKGTAIKYNSQAKQMAENIDIKPVFFTPIADPFQSTSIIIPFAKVLNSSLTREKWRTGQFPDLLTLIHVFLI